MPTSAPDTSAMMGIFAPQGIIVVVMTVMRRSFSFSMVLVAMTAGTPQPVAMSMGMKVLPESPKLRKMRSMTNATRARYPHASRNESSRNKMMSWGMNPMTAPTPATMLVNHEALQPRGAAHRLKRVGHDGREARNPQAVFAACRVGFLFGQDRKLFLACTSLFGGSHLFFPRAYGLVVAPLPPA